MTQVELAAKSGMTQSEVSKLEARIDIHISTLERYAAALGGELELHIKKNGHSYRVSLASEGDSK
jgi:transcriptional regulator with XRE-family HTH domain